MHSVEELRELAASETPPEGLELPLPEGDSEEDLHKLMLARLAFELAERKR
jgi:THO complex subunit 5